MSTGLAADMSTGREEAAEELVRVAPEEKNEKDGIVVYTRSPRDLRDYCAGVTDGGRSWWRHIDLIQQLEDVLGEKRE